MSKNWNNDLKKEPVTAYIEEDTKKEWEKEAEEMDVSLSKFIEMMVEAGRSFYKQDSIRKNGK